MLRVSQCNSVVTRLIGMEALQPFSRLIPTVGAPSQGLVKLQGNRTGQWLTLKQLAIQADSLVYFASAGSSTGLIKLLGIE